MQSRHANVQRRPTDTSVLVKQVTCTSVLRPSVYSSVLKIVGVTVLHFFFLQLVGTMVSRPVAERLGKQYSVVAGSLLTIAACVSMLFIGDL